MNSTTKCRGLSAEEEVVLLHLLDVKMFLKKQELKERMTSARKKSLGSVSSLSQALLYPSICQMKARLSKTTSHSNSTSSPLNSSAESSSFRERENSEEEMEAPKTCPQRRRSTQPWLLERRHEDRPCSVESIGSLSDHCLEDLQLKTTPKLRGLSDDSSRITIEVTLQYNAEERHLLIQVHGYRIKGVSVENCQGLYFKATLLKEKEKWVAIVRKRQPLNHLAKKLRLKLPNGPNLSVNIQVKRERGFRVQNELIGSVDLGPKMCGASNSAHWEAALGCPGVPFVMCHRLDDGPGLAGS